MHRSTVYASRRGTTLGLLAAAALLAPIPVAAASDGPPAADAVSPTTPPVADPVMTPPVDGTVPGLLPPTRAQQLVDRLAVPLPPGQSVTGVAPKIERGAFVAKVLEATAVRDRPDGARVVAMTGPTTVHTGNATRLMVLAARFDESGRPWLQVQLPIRPNATAGWLPADDVRVESTDAFIRVRLNARTISVYRKGRLWSRSRAVIGAAGTPTPRGLFAIYETAYQGSSSGFLGPWALHLTAFSDVLENYGGGPGRAAIHGRGPESIEEAALGTAKSHGCVRVPNAFVTWLSRRVTAGTPVQITYR